MLQWKQRAGRLAHTVLYETEKVFDAVKFAAKKRLGRVGPASILPYRGHGNEEFVFLKGRVLEDKGIAKPSDKDTLAGHLKSMYLRFASDEIPGVRVRGRFQGSEQIAVTDEEGYFQLHLKQTGAVSLETVWHDVELELLDAVGVTQGAVTASGQVLIPPPESEFAVISDLDDTVIQTGAINFWKMARTTLFQRVHTRLPFEGVAAFYRALQRGQTGGMHNPIFYVSSSPWNLYDLLVHFLDFQGIPIGPLFLQDLGLDREKFIKTGHSIHKAAQIEGLLAAYPHLSFILIGDTGQDDPIIYRQVIHDHPNRILTVYLRDVAAGSREPLLQKLAAEAREEGVELVTVADTEAAALHAASEGFIDAASLPDIRAEKAKDQDA